jgi:hypothetical protein
MATKHPHFTERRWSCSALVGLLITLTAWTSAWPLRPLGAGIRVSVHAGQLSVDLREAQVQDVLAAIGQQAGFLVRVDASANRTVNAQFTDMELDQGLRRLLRAASLSYTLLYAQGPEATVSLQEVRVFGEAHGAAAASNDRPPIERAQRAVARLTSPLYEERAEPEPTEPEQEAEPEPVEPESDVDTAQD